MKFTARWNVIVPATIFSLAMVVPVAIHWEVRSDQRSAGASIPGRSQYAELANQNRGLFRA